MKRPQIVSSKEEFNTPWFSIISKIVTGMPGSKEEKYYALFPDDYVAVLGKTIDGKFLFVKQYRPAIDDYSLEPPSGHVDPGESALEAAKRELLEETGYSGGIWEFLGELSPDTARFANKLQCYFATDLTKNLDKHDHEEGLEIVLLNMDDLRSAVCDCSIINSPHLALILLAQAKGKLGLALA